MNITLEERVYQLEKRVKELTDLTISLGNQNAVLKTKVADLETDIKIIRQGGNL